MSIWNPIKSKFGNLFVGGLQVEKPTYTENPATTPLPLSGKAEPPYPSDSHQTTQHFSAQVPVPLSDQPKALPSSESAAYYYKEGLKCKNPETQISLYLTALQIKPDYVEALYSLAMAYKRKSNREKVYDYLRKVYDLDKSYEDCSKQLADIVFSDQNYVEASEYFASAAQGCSDSKQRSDFYSHLSFCYERINKMSSCAETKQLMYQALVKAYNLDKVTPVKLYLHNFSNEIWFQVIEDSSQYDRKKHGQIACYKADRYWQHGFILEDRELAVIFFQIALEHDPNHVKSHYSLGCHYKKSHNKVKAIYHFSCIEKCSPNYEDVRNILSTLGVEKVDAMKAKIPASTQLAPNKKAEPYRPPYPSKVVTNMAGIPSSTPLPPSEKVEPYCPPYPSKVAIPRTANPASTPSSPSKIAEPYHPPYPSKVVTARPQILVSAQMAPNEKVIENLAITQKEQKINALESMLAACREEMQVGLEKARAKENQLMSELDNKDNIIAQLRQASAKFESHCDDGAKHMKELSCQNKTLSSELQLRDRKLQECLQENYKLRTEHESLQIRVHELEDKNRELKQLHQDMVSFAQSREIDLDNAKRENLKLMAELAEDNTKTRGLRTEPYETDGSVPNGKRGREVPLPASSSRGRVPKRSGTSGYRSCPTPPPQASPVLAHDFYDDIKI